MDFPFVITATRLGYFGYYRATMISDNDLFQLAIFLGSCAVLLIVLYHILEVNAKDSPGALATAASFAAAAASSSSTGSAGVDIISSVKGAFAELGSSSTGGGSVAGGKRR